MANLVKQTIGITKDLVMMAKKKRSLQQTPRSRLNEKYFNYGKKDHYARDCPGHTNRKRKSKDKKVEQEAKRER